MKLGILIERPKRSNVLGDDSRTPLQKVTIETKLSVKARIESAGAVRMGIGGIRLHEFFK